MIRCAAIRLRGSGLVLSMDRPARHHTILHTLHDFGARLSHEAQEQGFLTFTGEFVTRERAFALTGKGRGGKTFSEDLW